MRVIKNTIELIRKMKLYDKINGGLVPFEPWPRQVEWLDYIHCNLLVIMLKKRQVAGSTLTGIDSLCQCALLDNFLTLVLSKTGEDSEEHLRRVLDCYNSLDDDIKKAIPIKGKPTLDKIEFENGSRFISLPANKGAGYTPDRVVVDEAPKITMKNSKITLEIVLNNVYPGLEKSQGQLIVLGTAEGYGIFKQKYDKAKRGVAGWKSFFFSCWDDPTFTKEKRQAIVEDMGEDLANQEYPRNDSEAFLMSGRSKFNPVLLAKRMENANLNPEIGVFEEINGKVKFIHNPSGWVKIFKHVKSPNEVYVIGNDVAEGIEKDDNNDPDFSASVVLNRDGIQCAQLQIRFEPDVFAKEVYLLHKYYNNAFTGVERNKDGLFVLKELQRLGCKNLYYQEEFNPDTHIKNRKLGWVTDRITKPQLVSYVDQLIREEKIYPVSEDLISELLSYVVKNDGTTGAQGGCHDDIAMAFFIACWMLKFAPESNNVDFMKSGVTFDGYKIMDIPGFEESKEAVGRFR